ncbi:MAG: alanine--glyoxylate aminotransferase [Armatimonadetes bacterium CG_4_10_14_3_um_filter_66_18]|nr:alanine--glyoxylate aminotransferase family protein [Armatimonadota bacterium]OIP05212.1 MAG: alanine--glyoxylate aminotransferase [Armatimonadetes bacterium CG2_30_66_41]PIX49533.1 MAG: alanine--glyoxylate aminotransferase [Armatimonadetes bacterium CG_4_8_14_3_um_filter_66_20]PIY46039.1 MAG: alanine--glyoxylate aminotransferase [Armatimonadetes bacterium CG_4_10_14_3_um_filter_66_18]PIZ32549.1 MAG: alanine--glyoxylate aminotransferase [Armatimonadetes bacterium CG_4_10_14_0_8_um_filter_66_
MTNLTDLRPRLLMGPGPSDVHPRVLEAMARPTVGHLDPQFLGVLNDIRERLQAVFQTKNELTLAVSGTGSAGMETCVVNLIEPGDKMLVCIAGVFGQRMTDVARRAGATVTTIDVPWGQVFTAEQVQAAISQSGPFKVVGIVNAETSTGAAQPIPEISKVVHDAGSLLLVDTVTSLGGMEVDVDGWQIDACYSGTQKCLSCPPGLSPVTFSPAAVAAMDARQTKVQSWYLDMSLVRQYWGTERLYHHTAPINMNYALHEALRLVLDEGLQARWQRHARVHESLKSELESLGLRYLADPAHQLPMLNAVATPEGVDEGAVRKRLLDEYDLEIGGGLGEHKGKAWRIGLMGESATPRHVEALVSALKTLL